MTPAGTSNELDVQNEWEENTHTHTHTIVCAALRLHGPNAASPASKCDTRESSAMQGGFVGGCALINIPSKTVKVMQYEEGIPVGHVVSWICLHVARMSWLQRRAVGYNNIITT